MCIQGRIGLSGCKKGLRSRFEHARKTYVFLDWVTVFLPAVGWLRQYNIRRNLLVSLSAFQAAMPSAMWCLMMLPKCQAFSGVSVSVARRLDESCNCELYAAFTEPSGITIVHVQADVLAGTSVAALVVPQGMSYAALAGLPSVYGLYGAFVPVLCYAALGSSRHLVRLRTCRAVTCIRDAASPAFCHGKESMSCTPTEIWGPVHRFMQKTRYRSKRMRA